MENKNSGSCFIRPEGYEDDKAMDAVEAWHDSTEGDVMGSYTGMDENCNSPVQDADDL